MSDLRLPPERFYWAVLDTGGLGKAWGVRAAARRRAGLDCMFEESLPVPIETVQAGYVALRGGRVVACGMDREQLRCLAVDGRQSLGPAACPAFVPAGFDAGSVNLLIGDFEPRRVRRARRLAAAGAAGAAVLCATFVLAGIERRIGAAVARSLAADGACAALYSRMLPGPSTQSPQVRLLSELRTLRQTRAGAPPAPSDAAVPLGALLASWPGDCGARVESLSVGAGAMTLAAQVDRKSVV